MRRCGECMRKDMVFLCMGSDVFIVMAVVIVMVIVIGRIV